MVINSTRMLKLRQNKTPTPSFLVMIMMILMAMGNSYYCHAYCPVVICPGFGTCSKDYETDSNDSKSSKALGLKSVLEQRGFDPDTITTVPVERSDWIRVAGGLLDVGFYSHNAKPTGVAYGWYIDRLKQAVNDAYERSGGEKVILMAHSAGGWLARAAMADGSWSTNEEDGSVVVKTNERVRCLVTLGSVHKAPEREETCVTRGCLKYTDKHYPGSFLKRQGIQYITVGGTAIYGNDKPVNGNHDFPVTVKVLQASPEVAFKSYEKVCGKGACIGDGIVPFEWTQLDGARNIKLDGVLHHHLSDNWYGSETVIDRWLPEVLEETDLVKKKHSSRVGYRYYGQHQAVNLRRIRTNQNHEDHLVLHNWNLHLVRNHIIQRGGLDHVSRLFPFFLLLVHYASSILPTGLA